MSGEFMQRGAASAERGYVWRQKIGFPLGVALWVLILVLPTPQGLSPAGQRAAVNLSTNGALDSASRIPEYKACAVRVTPAE
jgi:hypothetical protein